LLEEFTPQDITPLQVGERILAKLNEHALQQHYAPAVRTKLDLLFYVNLKKHFLQIGPMPPPAAFAPFGWRSISAVIGHGSLVFFAKTGAPDFLYANAEKLIQRSTA
jgi:hypothetical protein